MHSAARHTLKAVISRRATTTPKKVQALFQMARALARADLDMAQEAMHSLPPLAACIRIDERGLTITQPPADGAGGHGRRIDQSGLGGASPRTCR